MGAMDGHDMQPPSDSRASVKEGLTLPPPSVLELNKALEQPQPQWMRLIVSNLKAYARLRAGEVGEVPRPTEFKGIVVLYKAEWLVHNDS